MNLEALAAVSKQTEQTSAQEVAVRTKTKSDGPAVRTPHMVACDFDVQACFQKALQETSDKNARAYPAPGQSSFTGPVSERDVAFLNELFEETLLQLEKQ